MTQSTSSATAAAAIVNQALETLSQEDRVRVLAAAAALFGVPFETMGPQGSVGAARSEREYSRDENVGAPTKTAKKKSLVEVLQVAQPATNSQRIAVFAHYHETIGGIAHFARADLLQYFSAAKEPKPGNYDRDFSGAVREGWIHEEGSNSYLTTSGANAVKVGFGGKAKPRGKAVSDKKA